MGYVGKLEEKLRAQTLRHQGLSYKEILQQIHVSKDTISRWCKDIALTEKQKLRLLNNKMFGQKKGSLIAAENKRLARISRTKEIQRTARQELGRLTARDKLITGIALYAAEGTKGDGKGGFANSDPSLIKFMVAWLTQFAKVSQTRLRGALWLHEGLNEKEAKKFWSNLTGIPLAQFNKTYIAKIKSGSRKIRKNIHQYGVFTIRFSDSTIHRKIMGWIYTVFDDKIESIPG